MAIPRPPAWIVIAGLSLAALEGAPYLLAPMLQGRSFDARAIRDALLADRGTYGQPLDRPDDAYLTEHLVHPYMGFTSVPRPDYNRYGLPGADPLMRRAADTVNVCITGGSVAQGLFTFGSSTLASILGQDPRWASRHFRFTALALGGFKQPQPLEALAWFLAQGAHYDLVIALDGFNDIVLPWCDNKPFGIHPSYPRHWNVYARKHLDTRLLRVMTEQEQLRQRMRDLRDRLKRRPWRWSGAALYLSWLRDQRLAREFASLEEKARTLLAQTDADAQATGPATDTTRMRTYREDAAELWMRSALLMHGMVAARGGRFFHFLQPNQYVPGSKPMGRDEQAVALAPVPFCYREAVEQGYPLLRDQATSLTEQGVRFTDLTDLFRSEHRPMYSDACCHFTNEGYEAIARAIGGRVVREP